jgi:hypothetical protein
VRGKFRALLTSKRPDLVAPHNPAWVKRWIVNITPWGQGERACSITLRATSFASPSPILVSSPSTITPSPSDSKHRKSSRWRSCRLEGHEFIRRFLQHVLAAQAA